MGLLFVSFCQGIQKVLSQRSPSISRYVRFDAYGDSAFYYCNSLIGIILPNSVTSIGDHAFTMCSSLTSITIPNSVISIGDAAFILCSSLTSINIPESVTSIGNKAFYDCESLSAAYFYGNAPSIGSQEFDNTKSGFTGYYLDGKSGFSNPWYGYPTATFIKSSTISPTAITFDKKISAQADIPVTVTLIEDTLINITNGVTPLNAGTDYSVEGSTYTMKKGYLATLPLGIASLTFNFSAGTAQILTLTVLDSTTKVQYFSASNGNVSVNLSSILTVPPVISDFVLTQSINGAIGTLITTTSINTVNATVHMVVPLVKPAAFAQTVVDSISYQGGLPVTANAFTVLPEIATPLTDLSATPGNGQVNLTFTAPIGADSVSLMQKTGTGSFTQITSVSLNHSSTEATITGLSNGAAYTFKLVVVGGSFEGNSNEVTITPNELVYDVTSDWTNGINPNGTWSYGWLPSLGRPFVLAAYYRPYPTINSMWYGGGLGYNLTWKNTSSVTYGLIKPGEVALDPSIGGGTYSVIRWTAPVTGTVTIDGYFGAGDTNWENYYIYKNGTTQIFQQLHTYGNGPFALTENVVVGDTIDFIVGIGNDIYCGNTPLHAKIALSTPVKPKTYGIKVFNLKNNSPISGATVSIDGSSHVSDNYGIVLFTHLGETIRNLSISKKGYSTYNNSSYTLKSGQINEIAIDNNFVITRESFNTVGSANDILKGPDVNLLGKSFNLFELPIGSELNLFDIVETSYDNVQNKYVVKMGDMENGKTTDYKEIKEFVNFMGGSTNRDFYNTYRKIQSKLKAKNSKLGFDFNTYSCGYMEFDNSKEMPVLSEGGFLIVAEADASISYPLPPAPYIYLKFGVKGEANGKLALVLKEVGTLTPSIDIKGVLGFSVTPYLGIGAGAEKIASIELGLQGKIDTTFDVIPSNKTFRDRFIAELTGTVYIKCQAFGFINPKQTWDFSKVRLYPRPPLPKSLLSMSIDTNDFVLAPRDYAENPSNFIVNNLKKLERSLNSDISTIKTNVYPFGQPKLVSLGEGKQLLVWVDDDLGRTLANRTALMYSVFDGSTWSETQQINNDGTADFSPQLATVGSNVHIVWQNANRVLEDTVTMDEMTQAIDITYAKFDGSDFVEVTNLKANQNTVAEISPVIASDGQEISVVWIENTLNNPFGLDGTNSFYRTMFKNGSWSVPQVIDSDLSLITSVDTGYNNSTNVIAYSVDMDGDSSTTNDTEVFLVNGNQKQRLTNDAIGDSSVQFVKQGTGSDLYWNANGAIKHILQCNVTKVQELGLNDKLANFKVLANENDNKAIVFEQPDGFSSELYGMYYDKTTLSWGQPIKLTSLKNKVRLANGYMDEDGSIKMAFDLAEITPLTATNSDPYGNVNLMVYNIAKQCDISLVGGIAFDDELVAPNTGISLYVKVKNNGIDDVTKFQAVVMDNYDQVISSESININITSGAVQEIAIPYMIPSNVTKNNIKVQILPIGMSDSDLSDNILSTVVGYADIAVTSATVVNNDQSKQIDVVIRNSGFDDARDINIIFRKESISGDIIETKTIPVLYPDSDQIVTFDVDSQLLNFQSETDKELFYLSADTSSPESLFANNSLGLAVDANRVTAVYLDKSAIELKKGFSYNLSASISPEDASNRNVVWLSDDESIATVDSVGVVTGVDEGTINITAVTIDGNKTAVCNVTVLGASVITDVTLNKSTITLQSGQSEQLIATVNSTDAAEDDVTWSVYSQSGSNIATVLSSGQVYAINVGDAVIRATSNADPTKYAECSVIVMIGSGSNLNATPLVQIGINPNDGDSAGIFVGLKDIRDGQGNAVPDGKLASYQIDVNYYSDQATVLTVNPEVNLGYFDLTNTSIGVVSVADSVYQGTSNFEKLFFVSMAINGPSNNITNVTIKFTNLLDQNSKSIGIPDVTLTFQRGKIINDSSRQTLSSADAVAGLQYLANIVDAGLDQGEVNVINMASILMPEGTKSIKPSVKDVIALMQKLVGLRDDSFQISTHELRGRTLTQFRNNSLGPRMI